MTALAELQYWRDTDLYKNYTPAWRNWVVQESPEIEWKYWLKNPIPFRNLPVYFNSYFCFNDSHRGFYTTSSQFNHMACVDCGLLYSKIWPLVIFECDECEELFLSRFPVRYELCPDCGG